MDEFADLLGEIFAVLGDFWFEMFAPIKLILALLILGGAGEVIYYLSTGGWAG